MNWKVLSTMKLNKINSKITPKILNILQIRFLRFKKILIYRHLEKTMKTTSTDKMKKKLFKIIKRIYIFNRQILKMMKQENPIYFNNNSKLQMDFFR